MELPLESSDGQFLGILEVFRDGPCECPDGAGKLLRAVAGLVASQLELHLRLLSELDRVRGSYRALVETVPQKVFCKDLEGRFTFVNRAFCSELGKRASEVIGRTDFDFYPEDLAAKYREDDQLVMETGDTFRTIEDHRVPDQETSVVEVTKTAIRNGAGEVLGVLGVFDDLTEHLRTVSAVREKEAVLRGLYESAPMAMGVVELVEGDIRLVTANAATLRFFNLQQGEPLARLASEAGFEREQITTWTDMFMESRRKGGPVQFDYVSELSGSPRWLQATACPVEDPSGRCRFAYVVEDVTERRAAEEALRESEARFHAFMDNSPGVAVMKNEQGCIVYVNRSFERMFRKPLAEVHGAKAIAFLPPEAVATIQANDADVLNRDRPREFVEVIPTPDGVRREWLTMKFPFRDSRGERFLGSVGIDITERRELERHLARQLTRATELNDELELRRVELERVNAQLAEMVSIDALTGLKNRRHFSESLESLVALACREGSPLSLIMLDVDHFKPFNDTFGHPAGDAVLRTIARIIRDNMREHDVVTRFGGEEFAILLPSADDVASLSSAERLRTAIREYPWGFREVTASLGVATFQGDAKALPGEVRKNLVYDADQALYRSKQMGRDRVTHAFDVLAEEVLCLPPDVAEAARCDIPTGEEAPS